MKFVEQSPGDAPEEGSLGEEALRKGGPAEGKVVLKDLGDFRVHHRRRHTGGFGRRDHGMVREEWEGDSNERGLSFLEKGRQGP